MDENNNDRTIIRRPPPKFTLRCVSGVTFGKKYPLYGVMIIGRQNDCDIVLPADEISRQHTKLTVSASGIQVEDLCSTNGTFINGQKITKGIIKPDEELSLDKIRFLVQAGSTPKKKFKKSPTITNRERPPPSSGKVVYITITIIILAAISGYFALTF